MTAHGPETCDLMIRNAHVLTLDGGGTVHPSGAVAVRGSSIAAVGPDAAVAKAWRAARVIDAQGAVVHPGFVESHLHINATTCRGVFRGNTSKGSAGGPNYADWKAALSAEDELAATLLGGIEMLRHGFTCFVEPGSAFEPDAVAEGAEAVGIRCTLADPYLWDDTTLMDIIAGLKSDTLFARVPPTRERAMRLLGGQLRRNAAPDGIVHGHVALYGEGSASDALLQAGKAAADAAGTVLNTHIGFDVDLAEAMIAHWKGSRFRHLEALGVLGPNVTFVHMNVIDDDDVAPLVQHRPTLVWCPLNYLRGISLRRPTRLPEMIGLGVPVGLGTDSARQSTLGDCGFLALHLAAEIGQPITAETVLTMLTMASARAGGLDRLIGSLEVGKRADIVIRDPSLAESQPGWDVPTQLVAIGHGATADTVLVNGRIVLRHGRSTRIDEGDVFRRARASVAGVARRIGLTA